MGLSSIAQASGGFTDVPVRHDLKDKIDRLVKLGTISGNKDGRFNPNGNVTHGQAAKIIIIALDMQLVNPTKPTFKDIPRHHDFYQQIETLVANKIIKGYADGTFGASKPFIRAHMTKIISNSLALTDMSDIQFKDVPKSNDFIRILIKW